MARKRKQQAGPKTLNPKGLQMGFATNLDASTLPVPEHPLVAFSFERESVQPRR